MGILFYFFTLFFGMFFFSCKKDISRINCLLQNIPPIAKAGRDTIIVLSINSVTLNGKGSFDPDGKITGYQWLQVFGPGNSILTNQHKAQASAGSLLEKIYLFTLKVTDDVGLSTRDTIAVTVLPELLKETNNKNL